MKVFKLEGEEEATIELDKDKGILELSGRFLPQKPKEFFSPVFELVEDYITDPHEITVLHFKLDYFNTASSKKILDLLLLFEGLNNKGKSKVEVYWYCHDNDPDILEAGKGYAELVELPFVFKTY